MSLYVHAYCEDSSFRFRMKTAKLVTLFIICSWVFSGGAALYCHICASQKSWADCSDNNDQMYACPPDTPVCYDAHIVRNNNGTEVHVYQRGCGILHFCNGEECVEQGLWCKVNCCNTDACNESTILTVNYMTYVMIGLLTAAHLV